MCFTEEQLKVIRFIHAFRRDCCLSPKYEEIARHLGVSKSTVYGHIVRLAEKGALRREHRRYRSIELLVEPPPPAEALFKWTIRPKAHVAPLVTQR